MIPSNLPLPTPETLIEKHHGAETLCILIKLRADIEAAIRTIEPATLLALAYLHAPQAATNAQAAALLSGEVANVLSALARHGEAVRRLAKAEHDRLAPLVAEAGRRSLEIPSKLAAIAHGLRFMDIGIDERRNRLLKSGVKPADADQLLATEKAGNAARRADLNAQHEALLTEQESLELFLKTRDERYLPEGFSIRERWVVAGCTEAATLP